VGVAAAAAPKPAADSAVTTEDIARLERARDKRPERYEARDELALAHYRYARGALDRREFTVYEKHLALAMEEWLASLRIEPRNPGPHIFMGIVSAYQGRIDDALDSMQNARSLEPRSPVAYTNIAETLIYAGRDAREVEGWLERGQRLGASPALIELNYCLLRWRDGNAESAARNFYRAAKFDPEVVRVWNEAPVSSPIKTFEDLTNYCCGSPACGPYLAKACATASVDVVERELPEETVLRELRIEIERRREIERIYRERRELEIRVKKAEEEGAGAGQSTEESAREQP
jgi:tetratricopeptide (TPR) repeat protein